MITLTRHAERQAVEKGFSFEEIIAAAYEPEITYESYRHPGQRKHIRGTLCVVIDPAQEKVITVFLHLVETDLRPDQIANKVVIRRG